MDKLNKKEVQSFKDLGYSFEEISHIDKSLSEKGGHSTEETYFMLLKNREKALCIK